MIERFPSSRSTQKPEHAEESAHESVPSLRELDVVHPERIPETVAVSEPETVTRPEIVAVHAPERTMAQIEHTRTHNAIESREVHHRSSGGEKVRAASFVAGGAVGATAAVGGAIVGGFLGGLWWAAGKVADGFMWLYTRPFQKDKKEKKDKKDDHSHDAGHVSHH